MQTAEKPVSFNLTMMHRGEIKRAYTFLGYLRKKYARKKDGSLKTWFAKAFLKNKKYQSFTPRLFSDIENVMTHDNSTALAIDTAREVWSEYREWIADHKYIQNGGQPKLF